MARAKFEYKKAYNKPFLTVLSWTVGAGYAASFLFSFYMFFNRLWVFGIILLALGVILLFASFAVNRNIDISNALEYKYYQVKEDIQKQLETGQITQAEYERKIKNVNMAMKEDRKQLKNYKGKE